MAKPSPPSGNCPHLSTLNHTSDEEHRFRDLIESAPDAMVIVNDQGDITLVNSQSQSLFGYSREELIGQKIELLIPERIRTQHIHHRESYTKAPKLRGMGVGIDLYGQRKDGSEFPVEISLSPLRTKDGLLVVSAIRDISARREIEQQLRDSIQEKEVLLKEVHHRVKNNLQVISSLLNFQAELITDAATRSMFQDTRSRIKSIALIHERLYQSDDLSHIDLNDYVLGLMDDLFDSYAIERTRIKIKVDIDEVLMDVDTLVNCGLIISELTSNALKYAFPEGEAGTVQISLKNNNSGKLELVVVDDGVGLPKDEKIKGRTTLGLKLVNGLARELGGTLEVLEGKGAQFKIAFALQ